MTSVRLFLLLAMLFRLLAGPGGGWFRAQGADAGETAELALDPAYEALQRLKGMDVEVNPALKAAVLRVLESARGTGRFVEIVSDFSLAGQETGLLEVARKRSGESAGAAAVRLLLRTQGGGDLLAKALSAPEGQVASAGDTNLVRALANAADPAGVSLLAGLLLEAGRSAAMQTEAVRGLARTEAGARRLLELGRGQGLSDSARLSASLELAQCRWPSLREEAARVLPVPRTADGGALPSPAELAGLRGDPVRGAAVFRGERGACIRCHRVGAEGVDFGPALSGIGAKLARQALFESILDPSAGISFGYEGWSLERKDGEEVFGILASETAEVVRVRQASGVTVSVPRDAIARRERQRLSIMPSGLAQLLTRQELVDLVEYLVSLREGGVEAPVVVPEPAGR